MEKNKRKLIGRVTLQNIADEAQISVASVSAVLSNRHIERRIAFGTVEKVRTVAARLGYLPNIGARRLRRGESGGSAVVVALITSYEAPFNIAKPLPDPIPLKIQSPISDTKGPIPFLSATLPLNPSRTRSPENPVPYQ